MNRLTKMMLFVFLPIFLTISGEFILKIALNASPIVSGLAGVVQLITYSEALFGILCIVVGGVLWLVAMSKFELSFIYPFLSINYIVIMIGSDIALNESVGWNRYVAIGLIIIGLGVISRSPYSSR